MAAQATIDLAYGMILEHTLAERERRYSFAGCLKCCSASIVSCMDIKG